MWALIGYLGMLVTVMGFMFKDVVKLRITSFVACALWVAYGIHRQDMPIILVNISVILIHTYYLIKLKYGTKNQKEGI